MYVDNHAVPSDTIMTVDAYVCDRRSDTYFARKGNWPTYGIKRKNETADLEK